MTRSETITKIAVALVAAQGKFEMLKTNGIAKTEKYSFKYADLAAVWDTIRAPLAANGLAIIQDATAEGTKVAISTMLIHTSGEWFSTVLTLTAATVDIQKIGSAITYGRRYTILCLLGLATEDDDGVTGNEPGKQSGGAKPTAKAPAPAASKPTGTAAPVKTGTTPAPTNTAEGQDQAKQAAAAGAAGKAPAADGKVHRTPDQMRKEIANLCLEMATGDSLEAIKILEEITRWEKKEDDGSIKIFPGKKKTADITDKAGPVVLRKVEQKHKAHFAMPITGDEEPTPEAENNGEVVE